MLIIVQVDRRFCHIPLFGKPMELIEDALFLDGLQTVVVYTIPICSVWARMNASHSSRVNTPGEVPMARTQLAPRALGIHRIRSAIAPCRAWQARWPCKSQRAAIYATRHES
jgi:hypothetical protein